MSDLAGLEMELKELRRQMSALLHEAREDFVVRLFVDKATTVLTGAEVAQLVVSLLHREGIAGIAILETP